MSNLPAYRKTLAAIIGAVLTWGSVAQVDGIAAAEWWGLAVAVATAAGVFAVSNEAAPRDRGQSVVGALVFILCLLVLLRIFGLV